MLCWAGEGGGWVGVEGAEPVKKVLLWKRETKIFKFKKKEKRNDLKNLKKFNKNC